MSPNVIDAIRSVDPCPTELPPPPVEAILARLREEADGGAPPDAHERPRERSRSRSGRGRVPAALGGLTVALSAVAAVGVAALAIIVLGHNHRTRSPSARPVVPPPACRSEVRVSVLPVWARAGFSDPRPRMPFALGGAGRIAVIPFGSLNSPPADHTNKILWVSHVPVRDVGSDLRIEAQRMRGTTLVGRPVFDTVIGGPGPSIVNVPSPGCWRFTLRWSGWTDHVDLQYR